MKKTIILISLAIVCLIFIFTCSTEPICMAPSSTPLNNRTILTNYGQVEGKYTAVSLFGLWMIDTPNLDLAINDALTKKGGDALINIRCYSSTKYYILFSLYSIIVDGEAVKFSEVNTETKDNEKK